MQKSYKRLFFHIASCALFLASAPLIFAQAGSNPASEWPTRASGEFAFYRDYTFTDPAWTGVLFYDEATWAVQVFFPGNGKRITAFFSTESKGSTITITGQRNDPNITDEDVPLVNYLMQIFPLLWEARAEVENKGATIRSSQSLFPQGARLEKNTGLFGGKSEFVFSAELPLFGLKSVNNSSGRTVFAFESAGVISQENSDAFFKFEPVPQNAKRMLAETQKSQRNSASRSQANNSTEEIISVAPNFFLVGNTASVLTGSGEIRGLSDKAFYAFAAKNFLLSGDSSVLPVPGTFAHSSSKEGVWLDQVLYMKEEKKLMRKRMLIVADFKGGKYSFAEVSCFESEFAQNKARLESVAASLLTRK